MVYSTLRPSVLLAAAENTNFTTFHHQCSGYIRPLEAILNTTLLQLFCLWRYNKSKVYMNCRFWLVKKQKVVFYMGIYFEILQMFSIIFCKYLFKASSSYDLLRCKNGLLLLGQCNLHSVRHGQKLGIWDFFLVKIMLKTGMEDPCWLQCPSAITQLFIAPIIS
jgi:hypothetical protein